MKIIYILKENVDALDLEINNFNIAVLHNGTPSYAIKKVEHYNGEDYEIFIDLNGEIFDKGRLTWNANHELELDMRPYVQDLLDNGVIEERFE